MLGGAVILLLAEATSQPNRYLLCLGAAGLSAVVWFIGYMESRAYPHKPALACGTWIWALLIGSAFFFGLPLFDGFGPILAIVFLIVGVVWIARYWERHKQTEP